MQLIYTQMSLYFVTFDINSAIALFVRNKWLFYSHMYGVAFILEKWQIVVPCFQYFKRAIHDKKFILSALSLFSRQFQWYSICHDCLKKIPKPVPSLFGFEYQVQTSVAHYKCVWKEAYWFSAISLSKWPPGGHTGFFGFRTLTLVWLWKFQIQTSAAHFLHVLVKRRLVTLKDV